MIPRVFALGLAAGVVFTLAILPSPGRADEPAATVGEGPSAAELTQAALEAEASGDQAGRGQLLAQALNADPECASARGHAGYVRVGNDWLSVEEAEQRADADERLAEYRRLRQTHAGTPTGELALARFCRDHDLDAEAKVHWLHVLQCQPNHQEALRSLGVRWHRGQLLTPAQIDGDAKRPTQPQRPPHVSPQARKRWEKHWTPLVHRWQQAIEDGDSDVEQSMQEELRSADDAVAMEVLDAILQERSGAKTSSEKEAETCRQLSLKLVEVLDSIRDDWAIPSLVRHAVFHPLPEARTAAADALGSREMKSYVPLLLSGMRTPIEAGLAISVYPGGSVSYYRTLYREGLDVGLRQTHSQFERVQRLRGDPLYLDGVRPSDADGLARQFAHASRSARGRVTEVAARTQASVEASNAAASRLNERIQHALSRATGADLGPNPTRWWAWWRERWYEDYELERPAGYEPEAPADSHASATPKKPVRVRETWSVAYHVVRVGSCFPRGTQVWTVTGPLPVEEIKVGDRVLSQHPESGELAYKPVLETTLRNPSPMVKIHLSSDVIETTRGHMFFVSGKGWRMAKELATGDLLRGVGGAVSIDRLEQLPAPGPWYEHVAESPDAGPGYGSAYNLIVDDFHTFFVGDGRLLVRDNTLFGRPYGRVPGLPAY